MHARLINMTDNNESKSNDMSWKIKKNNKTVRSYFPVALNFNHLVLHTLKNCSINLGTTKLNKVMQVSLLTCFLEGLLCKCDLYLHLNRFAGLAEQAVGILGKVNVTSPVTSLCW